MLTLKLKTNDILGKPRHRLPFGILVARMTIIFTVVCTVATMVMLAG